jgi:hypothetical protein
VDEEEIEEVSTDLSSSSDEKSNNGGEDVDNADMRDVDVGGRVCDNFCGVGGIF